MTQNSDQKFIAYALNLAKQNLGLTAPNPVVGCVIVKNGEIISSGVTAKNGRPHAEKIAIEKVANKEILRGATLYVTLEPCSHFGQTPPCVDEIIKCGFKKVVIATQDPDQRVNGSGIKKLQEAAIDVVVGVLEKEAREINRAFFKARQSGLPFVTLKLATSLDGKIATKNFDSKWITSQKSRLFAHHLRATNDAILVGANTIKKDNPSLDCRILGLEDFSPKRFVISNSLDFDLSAKVFQNCEKISTTILSSKSSDKFQNLILCDEKNGQVDLRNALEKLCQSGVNSVLVEGGQNIATQFLRGNLVDELVWIRSSKIIGDDAIAAIGDLGFVNLSEVLNGFTNTETRISEDDLIEIYRKK
ncbi:MAG: bifunctional diaminohydroxyphosphoribosylaminopyrimidine deaminase/5-amino-6-(5-phosphoribosylamino)uracil reductase RibD [Rickettsiales bacterium]|nr:bifunctional diaminohydroxyphosphoribosylaminopyrimidine deaminase/5-amino-6-(5-phosphoribosylamino)uracil reductase RibD [Rickettsiales bacterium]